MLPLRVAALVVVAFGTAVCALWEILMAWPVAWWLYLPLILFAGFALLRPVPPQRQPAQLAGFLAIAACPLALYFVGWTTRKPFLRDLARVRIGMTEAEVRRVMAGYLEGTGWPVLLGDAGGGAATLNIAGEGQPRAVTASPASELAIRDALVFRHSNGGRFNSDWGIVTITNGRVVRVEFSAD